MVNTRKRQYDVNKMLKEGDGNVNKMFDNDDDLFSVSTPSQTTYMLIDEIDLMPCQEINLNLSRKYSMNTKASINSIVKLLYVTIPLLMILVSHKYVYTAVKEQNDPVHYHSNDVPIDGVYKRMQELNLELKKLKLRCNVWSSRIILESVDERIQRALLTYDADKINIIDYALEQSGGSVTSAPDTFYRGSSNILQLFSTHYTSNPNTIIQPGISPGQCFAFKGQSGKFRLRLMHVVNVTAITLEHAHKDLVIDISTAPKDFRIYGLDDEKSQTGDDLGLYEYKLNKNPTQTFEVKRKSKNVYQYIDLQILSNYGNPEYTCLYRFRVHGKKA